MEYCCYIVGDAVTEPGALLRRLLYQPFPKHEEHALQQRSLLFTRSEEAKGTNVYHMAVSLPNLQENRAASLTLPNPSVPSVDVTVQFAAITDPREFERVMLSHYTSSSANRCFSRSPRRSFSSPTPFHQDLMSSDASSLPGGACGIALQSAPHALVLTFNPFSTCSFSKLRVEWVHVLHAMRQQQQRLQQRQQQQQQSKRSTAAVFGGSSVPASPLSPGHPVETVESFPVVLLVATRMELMRDTMEATPSIHVPSSLDVTEVAQALQAQAYVEVGTNWDESIDVLRTAIARACMGELMNAPLVAYNTAYAARQASVARAIEAVQMDPYDDDEEENGGVAGDGVMNAVTLTGIKDDGHNSGFATAKDDDDVGFDDQVGSSNTMESEGEEEVKRTREGKNRADASHRNSPDKTDKHARQKEEVIKRRKGAADASFDSASARALSVTCTAAQGEQRAQRAENSELNASDTAARSADPSGFQERFDNTTTSNNHGEIEGGEGGNVERSTSNAREPNSPESSMRGRQLRRHLVTALAPLAVLEEKTIEMDRGDVLAQSRSGRASLPPSAPPFPTQQSHLLALTAAAPPGTSASESERDEKCRGHTRKTTAATRTDAAAAAPLSTWTWRRHPRTGSVFYVHRASGKSQYACPDGYDGPPVIAASKGVASVSQNEGGTKEPGTREEEPQKGDGREKPAGGNAANNDHNTQSLQELFHRSALHDSRSDVDVANHDKEGRSAEYEEGEMQSLRNLEDHSACEAVDSWRQRQQLQLRRTQVTRLEHQIHQLRLQSERLHMQSEANASAKQKVAALRTELEEKEQAFSSRVAEQNQELAMEALNTTVAVEELSAVMTSFPLSLAKGGEEIRLSRNSTSWTEGAPLSGIAKDIYQAEVDIAAGIQQLQLAVSRRDAEATAVDALQRRRREVAQRTRGAEDEWTTLLKTKVKVEGALLSVQEELERVQTEEGHLRGRLYAEEETQISQEQQQQRQLEVYVEQKRNVEAQVAQLEQLRQAYAAAQRTYRETFQSLQLPSSKSPTPLHPAAVHEENKRLRLGLESTIGRCAEALLRNAELVHKLTLLLSDVESAERRIAAQQTEQQQRVVQAYEAAETRRAEAVMQKYGSSGFSMHQKDRSVVMPYASGGSCDYGASVYHYETPAELLEVAVDASAEALAQWQMHNAHVVVPLLERAKSVEAELLLLLRGVADNLPKNSGDVSLCEYKHNRKSGDGNGASVSCESPVLWQRWLQANIAGIRRDAEADCRAPLQSFLQHIAAMRSAAEVGVNRESSADRICTSGTHAGLHDSSSTPPVQLFEAVRSVGDTTGPVSTTEVSECGAALERGLWSTCDILVKRLSDLGRSFASTYTAMQRPETSQF